MAGGADLKQIRQDIQKALKKKEWERGVGLLGEWCRQRPADAKAWYYLAFFLSKMNRYGEAVGHVDRALSLDPTYAEAQQLRSFLSAQEKSKSNQEEIDRGRERVWREGNLVEGRYEVRGSKKGGMGEVYFAFDRELDHMVAIKAPLASILNSETLKSRFYREAEAWMGLGMHPHICAAYYVQELGGIPWLFIEYISGGTLDGWLKTRKLGFTERLDVAIQIASGMDHTHTFTWRDEDGVKHQGLVHRDLKPANILMDESGIARVTDFGLVGLSEEDETTEDPAVPFDESRPPEVGDPENPDVDWEINADVHWQTVTAAGMALGTPPYMAPEQWASAHSARFPTDIYAFGCILYDIFCARRPFVLEPKWRHAMAGHQMYIWEKMHREQEPPDPRELTAGLDDVLSELMLQCLAKAPDDRPKDFGEVKDVLKSIYFRVKGNVYPRPEPRAGRLMADSLNNHGVSFVTIGQNRRAEASWREALRADPHHAEATLNLSMYRWSINEIASEEVARRMEELGRTHGDSWRYKQLLGRMYLYFGDYTIGAKHLLQAGRQPGAGVKVMRELGIGLCAAAGSSQDAKRWGDVEKVFRQVLSMGYEDPSVIAGCALAIKRQDRADEAVAFYADHKRSFFEMPVRLEEAAHHYLLGQELIESVQHNGWVNYLAFLPGGDRLLVGSENKIGFWQIMSDSSAGDGLCGVRPALELETVFLQAGLVYAMCLSPDGDRLLTGGADGIVRLWSLGSEKPIHEFKGHGEEVRAVTFSPDGRYGVSGGADATVRLWDLQTGKNFSVLSGHTAPVNAVGFSGDGLYILSGSDDRTLRIWDSYAESCLRTLEGHTDRVTAAIFEPKGRYAISGGFDKIVRVWDVSSGLTVKKLEGHGARISSLACTRDGRRLISGAHDRTMKLWELKTGKLEKTLRFDNRVEAIAASSDAQLAAAAVANPTLPQMKTICLMQLLTKKKLDVPYAVTLPISVSVADVRDNEFKEKLAEARRMFSEKDYSGTLEALTMARDVPGYARDAEATAIWTELTTLFPLKGLRTAWEADVLKGHKSGVNQAAIDRSGTIALSAGDDNDLCLWDLSQGRCVRRLEGHTGPVTSVDFLGQGRLAASVSEDKTLRFWDLDTGFCTRVLMDQDEPIVFLDVSPDGRYALTLCGDEIVHLWDLRSQVRLKPIVGHAERVTAAVFSPDGRFILSGSKDKTVRLWDLEEMDCVRIFKGHPNMITAVAFSPDGRYIITACLDQLFRKYETEREGMPETFGGHSGPITAMAVSPDGQYMLSGSTDKTLRLWHLPTAQCESVLAGHADKVTSVAFGSDRQFAVSASADGTCRVWRFDWNPEIKEFGDWNESVRPYLDVFLTLHTAYSARGMQRIGRPHWTEADFKGLTADLSRRGYGWLDPAFLARELESMAKQRRSKFHLREVLSEFYNGIKMAFYPLKFLKGPLKFLFRLMPAGAAAYFLQKYDWAGLNPVVGSLVILFLLLIMFLKKRS